MTLGNVPYEPPRRRPLPVGVLSLIGLAVAAVVAATIIFIGGAEDELPNTPTTTTEVQTMDTSLDGCDP